MINKKLITFVSTLLVLIFHLWISITTNSIENFLRYVCVIGVDLFFFVSAYSIAGNKEINYKLFIKNRFINIYLKFLLFTIVYAIYASKNIELFFKTIFFINLFDRGGGSFLWFIPAIMIVYLLLPLYKKIDEKNSKLCLISTIIVYLGLVIGVSYFTVYNSIFIFVNRIPIILIGYYVSKYKLFSKINNNILYFIISLLLIIVGLYISYNYCYNTLRLDWFNDINYILSIPLELGIIMILSKLSNNKITDLIGSASLEVYAIQMIFGFKFANSVYSLTNNALISDIIVIISIIIDGIILRKIFDLVLKKLGN